MFEGKKEKTENNGKISYNRNILSSIVTLAASEVAGVVLADTDSKHVSRTCKIDFVDNTVYVELFIRLKNGYTVSELAHKVQESVKRSVETMTTFKVKTVNVHVVGVVFEEAN